MTIYVAEIGGRGIAAFNVVCKVECRVVLHFQLSLIIGDVARRRWKRLAD